MQVTTPATRVAHCGARLEGSVGLVQTEREELVLDVVLRDSSCSSEDPSGDGGKVAVLYPGNFIYLRV